MVNVSSSLHKVPAAFNFDDPTYAKGGYTLFGAYAQVLCGAGGWGFGGERRIPHTHMHMRTRTTSKQSTHPPTQLIRPSVPPFGPPPPNTNNTNNRASSPMSSSPLSSSGASRAYSRASAASTPAARAGGCWRPTPCIPGTCRRRRVPIHLICLAVWCVYSFCLVRQGRHVLTPTSGPHPAAT